MMGIFVNAFSNHDVDVAYIAAGYTCVLHPIDAGFKAIWKNSI
jgi:hypothetical protein